jgi:UDPglucose 6-dehydrogenase
MAVIADRCPGVKVNVVDINEAKIAAWQSDRLPIFEPGLQPIVQRNLGKSLFFHTDVERGIREADIIFVSVNTPTKTFGEGAGMASDLQYWEKTAREIRKFANADKIVVEKSTLPVKTAQAMERILNAGEGNHHFDVLSNPEFLAEGTAVKDLEQPDRVLIGGRQDTERGRLAMERLADLYRSWVGNEKILLTNVWSSELSKLAANAFLAQRVSSINALSSLCEQTEADIAEVAHAVGLDSRIGPKFLQASIGFGGSCFKKDILNLVYICRHYGLTEEANYWEQVVTLNEHQKNRFVKRMLEAMFNTIAGKKIAVFGFAFKANTGDTRESPAISVTQSLLAEHALVSITDPKALDNAAIDLKGLPVTFEADPYRSAAGAHAIVVLTEWPEFRELQFDRIFQSMEKPAFVFDGRNLLDHEALRSLGFQVYSIGKPPRTDLRQLS